MIKALVDKFHPMDDRTIQEIISSMQSLVLADTEDLSAYRDKLENYNLKLSWAGQEISPSFLVCLAQSQLGKSRYKDDIASLQMSHTASGTSYKSLDDLCQGLERLDKLRGLSYGGAAPSSKVQVPGKAPSNSSQQPKCTTPVGFISQVQGDESNVDSPEMHKDAWIGAINLPEDKVKLLRSMFKCVQCRTNDHTLPNCPLMKNWIIRKKPRESTPPDSEFQTRNVGGVSSVTTPLNCPSVTLSSLVSAEVSHPLSPVTEEPDELQVDDHTGNVEFDLLDGFGSLAVTTSKTDLPYPEFTFKSPLGSARSVSSHQLSSETEQPSSNIFKLIVDSSCTRHMIPYQSAFISYKATPNSYVVLADKSRVACLGLGTIQFSLQNKSIILHYVLHVPKLRSPLLSVRCFRWLKGCSFLANNTGSFLTFPQFVLGVDDSSDCTINGSLGIPRELDFDSRLVGSSSAVSDNTHFRKSRRPPCPSNTSTNNVPKLTTAPLSSSNTTPIQDLPTISEVDINIEKLESLHPLLEDLDLPPTALSDNGLSPTQIQEIAKAIISYLQKHGRVTTDLLHFIRDGYSSSKNSTSTTPEGHPTLLASAKMSNTAPSHYRFTIQQLSRYFGFRSFKHWDTLYDVCAPNFSFIQPTETPVELGNAANIKKSRSNKNPIDRPKDFLEVVHCDIGYGDTKSVGNGASYCIILVDHATRYNWIYPLKSLTHTSLKAAFSAWSVDVGQFPKRLYTDFDCKLLEGHTAAFLCNNKVIVRGSPSGRQNQNG
jgi:hypothetical protein